MKIPFLVMSCVVAAAVSAVAQTVSPVQSPARPFKLDIVAPVYMSGSDARSAEFQKADLPKLISFINSTLGETKALSNVASVALDPNKLRLQTDAEVRVYFVGEGAGFRNTLGINPTGSGLSGGNPALIFPNASSRVSWLGGTTAGQRTTAEPLLPGDFVDLGSLAGGQALDFFLIADGATNPQLRNVWTANEKLNSDGLQHMVSFAVQGSPYLLLGFEDLPGGGDRDFNDLLFAVDVGYKNVQALASPEPATILTFGLLAAAVFVIRQRLRRSSERLTPA